MSVKTVWICDGCGEELVLRANQNSDWACITVTLSGFKGYPVGPQANGTKEYELCPGCQRHLYDMAAPRAWPRMDRSVPEGHTEA